MKAQAAYDVIVVGAGLAGLFAGALSARGGARTLVIARGQGGTHVGAGCLDVLSYAAAPKAAARRVVDNPAEAVKALPGEHPLSRVGALALCAAVDEFLKINAEAGCQWVGQLERNLRLPSAAGAIRPTCLAPRSYAAGDLSRSDGLVLAGIAGFRDFYAGLAAANLKALGFAARAVTLELPDAPLQRDAFATDLARRLDVPAYRGQVAKAWQAQLKGATRLGLPAVVGLRFGPEAWRDLDEKLGLEVFEIPVLPPSVPGMRLYTLLRSVIQAARGSVLLGPHVTGWVEDGRVLGVVSETENGPRGYAAPRVILATGGFRHGGLEAPARGQVQETVFGLPVATAREWFSPLYWHEHPYARFGLRVNATMQPLDRAGAVVYPNVQAVGGVLAGADRNGEGSREGIDLATAWQAVRGSQG